MKFIIVSVFKCSCVKYIHMVVKTALELLVIMKLYAH